MNENKLKVIILCEGNSGMAARCLPILLECKGIEVVGVISATPVKRKKIRLFKKIVKIGILGALNGIRMRTWYRDVGIDLRGCCKNLKVKYWDGIVQNSMDLVEIIKASHADLGLSLGNGFISPRIFTIPKYGFINVHSEILPSYQNAQSIIWPIYCSDPYTGFTIHEIERKIDGGRILYQARFPIEFKSTLGDTVKSNRAFVESKIPKALAEVCEHFYSYRNAAKVQLSGASYTTPSIWQFLRIAINHNRFYRESR